MIDFEILKEAGTTNERLREMFTAKLPPKPMLDELPKEERKRIEKDIDNRKKIEDVISSRVSEHILWSLKNHHLYSSVDLAWDSTPITRQIVPLVLYAQKRINMEACVKELGKLKNTSQYVKKDAKGSVVGINLPKFFEVNINLIRSFVTRRLAAQSNRFNNLYPFFKYEARTTEPAGKLRADVLSQRIDVMADQYNYRHFQTQLIRDMFLYGHSVAFPRAAWERDVHWEQTPISEQYATEGTMTKKRTKIVREGVSWVAPHPTRTFYDFNYPLASLNTDTGCEYVGFWDICRFGDILENPNYFNRDEVGFSSGQIGLFSRYANYFNQYYTTITPPAQKDDLTSFNDRKNQVGHYGGEEKDTSVFITEYFVKIIPKDYGIGTYPFPVWVHLKVAGEYTVVYAEILPSAPASVFSFNENDSRLLNISVAHELMPFQDQLTNLFSQLLETAKADLFSVAIINSDLWPDNDEGHKALEDFRNTMKGENFYASTHALDASFSKLQDLGIDPTADNIFKVVRSQPNGNLTNIFNSITQLLAMAERLMALSPQEQGQPAPREISATEVLSISNTTDSVYTFISDAIDEGRASMKRVLYESLISCGSNSIHLPVLGRYTRNIIERAGFEVEMGDGDLMDPDMERRYTVIGSKRALCHDYIFTSRDGSERASNSQAANVLVQLIQVLNQPQVLGAIGKEKYFEIINEIFRLSGAGVDLKLELTPGDDDSMTAPDDQTQAALQQFGQAIQKNSADIQAIVQAIQGPEQPVQAMQ